MAAAASCYDLVCTRTAYEEVSAFYRKEVIVVLEHDDCRTGKFMRHSIRIRIILRNSGIQLRSLVKLICKDGLYDMLAFSIYCSNIKTP